MPFAVDKVAVALVSVTIIPPTLRTLLRLATTLIRRTNGQDWEPSTKTVLFQLLGSWDRTLSTFASFFVVGIVGM